MFGYLGKYNKAKTYLEKALVIRIEVCDRAGEAADYENLGMVFQSLGEYVKCNEYRFALAIRIEIRDRVGEAACYGNIGAVLRSLMNTTKQRNILRKQLRSELK